MTWAWSLDTLDDAELDHLKRTNDSGEREAVLIGEVNRELRELMVKRCNLTVAVEGRDIHEKKLAWMRGAGN